MNPVETNRDMNPVETIRETLRAAELEFDEPREDAFFVKLPGQRKLATMTWLIAGEHSLHVEAFFCRRPDENHAEFYRFLLEKNGRMYGVAFALDEVGDVHLVGKVPLQSVTPDEVDRLLGCVLTYSDENFDKALERGFKSSIQREWDWRVKRGESLANLQAFASFADPANRDPADADRGPANRDPADADRDPADGRGPRTGR